MMVQFSKLYEARGLKTVAALQRNGFDALYMATADDAAEKVLSFISKGQK